MLPTYPAPGGLSRPDRLLSARQVCQLLLDRGLITPADVTESGFTVVESFRRNRNFKVFGQSACYVVKQAADEDGLYTVQHEAAVYKGFERSGSIGDDFTATFHGHVESSGLIITGLVRGTHDLAQHSRRVARFSKGLAAGAGRCLATLHTLPVAPPRADQPAAGIGGAAPWVLRLHRPTRADYVRMTAVAMEVIRIVQDAPELCDRLDGLFEEWRVERIIHGDLKWDNCLVLAGRSDPRKRVRLIDWEFARLGDPAWDLGSMFANYLSWWLGSIPDMQAATTVEGLANAAFPLEKMHPALRAFWDSYRLCSGHADAATPLLMRAVALAGARLLQTAYEQSQSIPKLTRHVVGLLQLSTSVLTRPLEAAVQLLGFDVEAAPWPSASAQAVPASVPHAMPARRYAEAG
jgi:aminoglycoside phosphotransferase (APT) family kinase protein